MSTHEAGFPLPCPCCGSARPIYIEGNPNIEQNDCVECVDCYLQLIGTKEKGSALKRWNTRVPLPAEPTS